MARRIEPEQLRAQGGIEGPNRAADGDLEQVPDTGEEAVGGCHRVVGSEVPVVGVEAAVERVGPVRDEGDQDQARHHGGVGPAVATRRCGRGPPSRPCGGCLEQRHEALPSMAVPSGVGQRRRASRAGGPEPGLHWTDPGGCREAGAGARCGPSGLACGGRGAPRRARDQALPDRRAAARLPAGAAAARRDPRPLVLRQDAGLGAVVEEAGRRAQRARRGHRRRAADHGVRLRAGVPGGGRRAALDPARALDALLARGRGVPLPDRAQARVARGRAVRARLLPVRPVRRVGEPQLPARPADDRPDPGERAGDRPPPRAPRCREARRRRAAGRARPARQAGVRRLPDRGRLPRAGRGETGCAPDARGPPGLPLRSGRAPAEPRLLPLGNRRGRLPGGPSRRQGAPGAPAGVGRSGAAGSTWPPTPWAAPSCSSRDSPGSCWRAAPPAR